jgi:hypothetical protein
MGPLATVDIDELMNLGMSDRAAFAKFLIALPDASLCLPMILDTPLGQDGSIAAGTRMGPLTIEIEGRPCPVAYTTNDVLLADVKVDHVMTHETGRSLLRLFSDARGILVKGTRGAFLWTPET